jgi:F0F1-type ATP synthase assembly protein I
MDWMSYLIVFLVLFGLIATILTVVRFLLGKRLEKTEKKRQMEEEARQIAESNSGLRDLVPD